MSTKASKGQSVRTALARAQAYALLARAFGRPDARFEADVAEGRFGEALSEALAALGHQELAALDGAGFYIHIAGLARGFVAKDAAEFGMEPQVGVVPRVAEPEPEIACPTPGGGADDPR